MKFRILLLFILVSFLGKAQKENPANDPEAASLLQKVSGKYKSFKNISAGFKLIIQSPKMKPEEDDRKYADTISGHIILDGSKFKITVGDQQIFCDGKTIWTYAVKDKEVQENYYDDTDDVFSPSRIFNLYNAEYLYNIREKKQENGKKLTVIEVALPNKKLTYFKIDVTIDDAALQILESKIYEKNGVRYIYKMTQQTPNVNTNEDTFAFDAKKHPGVKVVDLK